MNTFLHIVTTDLIRRYTLSGLEHCTLVFPMQRAGLFVKQYLSSMVQDMAEPTPVVLPHFTTIDALADSLCDLQAEEEITSVCTLYKAYRQHTQHQLPIDAFYGWGIQLLNDFSSADMALVTMESFMNYTAEAKGLEDTILDEDTRKRLETLIHTHGQTHSIRQYFTDLWAALPAIYRDFQAAQLAAGVGTRGARTRWVIEHFDDETIQQRIAGRTYIFVGFNFLLKAERRLMQLFHDQHQALFYWDDDPSFSIDDTVYQFIHQNIQQFGNAMPPATCHLSPNITAMACQSSAAQAQYVHEWLLDPARQGGTRAIVIADESLLQSVIYALPEPKELDARINITKGYPLRSTVLYGQVLTILDRLSVDQTPADQLLPDTIHALDTYYHQLERTDEDGWQTVLLDESYYQIQLVLRQLYLLLAQNDFVRAELQNTRVLINLMRRKLESVTIPFHGEPITDVQIIGVLETRLLDFDHVLILNVEEDIVPSRSNDHSFLPYDLRREYGMATREEESRIYAYNFFRLLRRAQDVTLTFSDSFTDKGKRTMSRFLMQMLCSPNYTIKRQRLIESADVRPYAIEKTCFGDHADDLFPLHLSPSSISTYIECPRQFYLRSIRHISESSIDQLMLPINTLGILLHATVQQAYLTICAEAVNAQHQLSHPVQITPEKIQSYLQDRSALQNALNIAYQDQPFIAENHAAENHVILTLAEKVLKHDLHQAPFTLVWLEHWVSATIGGLTLQGVVDRMDIVDHGTERYLRILDYKTGGYQDPKITFDYDSLFTDPDKRYVLQTFIYSEMVRQNLPKGIDSNLPIRPELFFVKAKDEPSTLSRMDTLSDPAGKLTTERTPITDYRTMCATSFVPPLETLMRTIANNCQSGQEFISQPDDKICGASYCPFHLLCGREKTK